VDLLEGSRNGHIIASCNVEVKLKSPVGPAMGLPCEAHVYCDRSAIIDQVSGIGISTVALMKRGAVRAMEVQYAMAQPWTESFWPVLAGCEGAHGLDTRPT
jgi:hypothetical protein